MNAGDRGLIYTGLALVLTGMGIQNYNSQKKLVLRIEFPEAFELQSLNEQIGETSTSLIDAGENRDRAMVERYRNLVAQHNLLNTRENQRVLAKDGEHQDYQVTGLIAMLIGGLTAGVGVMDSLRSRCNKSKV